MCVGPSYSARTPTQNNSIAVAIRDTVNAKIIVLNEINGQEGCSILQFEQFSGTVSLNRQDHILR